MLCVSSEHGDQGGGGGGGGGKGSCELFARCSKVSGGAI